MDRRRLSVRRQETQSEASWATFGPSDAQPTVSAENNPPSPQSAIFQEANHVAVNGGTISSAGGHHLIINIQSEGAADKLAKIELEEARRRISELETLLSSLQTPSEKLGNLEALTAGDSREDNNQKLAKHYLQRTEIESSHILPVFRNARLVPPEHTAIPDADTQRLTFVYKDNFLFPTSSLPNLRDPCSEEKQEYEGGIEQIATESEVDDAEANYREEESTRKAELAKIREENERLAQEKVQMAAEIERLTAQVTRLNEECKKKDEELAAKEEEIKSEKDPREIEAMQHVIRKVDTKLGEFHVLLAKSKQSATSGVVRQQIPLKPEVFYGRDALVAEIAQLLMSEGTARVCILGPGGMGKTSVSLAVVESPFVQERFAHTKPIWVPCIGATSAALLIETLYVQLQIPGDKQPTVEKIIADLDQSREPRLLVLDNFETPWDAPGESQKHVGDILRHLAQLDHIALLVTMRGSHAPCDKAIKWQSRNIQPTDEEACRRTFYDINPAAKEDPDVGSLLRSLGYMPFAVTLMANLGQEASLTAKQLLDAWRNCGPDMFPEKPEDSIARSISLSVDSDVVRQNPDALLLLSVLSLLPAGTTKANLSWWAPSLTVPMVPAAIATLSKAALLIQNERQVSEPTTLFVIPVVQSFMRHQSRISQHIRNEIHSSCCRYVLRHARRYDLPGFSVQSKAIAAEDTNIHSVLFDLSLENAAKLSDARMEAILAFCWHRCDTKPSLEIVEHALKIARTHGAKRYIALATWCLGKSCHQVAKFVQAYEHLQEAYKLFNLLRPDRQLKEFACQCGNDLVDASRNVLPREAVVLLARQVEKKSAVLGNDLIHGRSLMYLAFALQEADRRSEALPYAEQARAALAGAGNLCHLANTLQLIARIYYYDKKLPEALTMISQASKLAQRSGSAFFEGFVAVEFGMILFTLGRDAEARTQIELALMKSSNYGNGHIVVLALDYMGYWYLRRGDYRNALDAYEAASGKWAGTNEIKSETACLRNIAKLRIKLRDTNAVIGFHRPGFDNDDSLFYPLS